MQPSEVWETQLADAPGSLLFADACPGKSEKMNSVGKHSLKLCDCRVRTTVDVICGKWKPLIIQALKAGKRCYGELRRLLPESTKKVLTAQLRELEDDRIISRKVLVDRIVRVEYALTEYGRTLVPILTLMREWGQKHQELVLSAAKEPEGLLTERRTSMTASIHASYSPSPAA